MTWLYIPKCPSTSSACAPAAAASIEPLSWQSQQLARFCTWRGSHSPSRDWSRRLKRASWLQRLSGAMCEPSTADAFADAWLASLGEFHASRIASPGAAAEATTSATSGLLEERGASSSSPGPSSSSLRTSAASSRRGMTKSLAPSGYGETYKNWVTRLRAASSARRTWVSRTNASGSSSSGWRTPTDDSRRGGAQDPAKRLEGGHTLNLQDQVLGFRPGSWPTPNALDGEKAPKSFAGGNLSLPQSAKTRSTPRASDGEKGGPNQSFGAGGVPLVAQATKWATPQTANRKSARAMTRSSNNGRRSGGGQSSPPGLEQMAEMASGQMPPEMVGLDLPPATQELIRAMWSTPSVADTTGGRKARSGDRSGEMLNNSLAPLVSAMATWATPRVEMSRALGNPKHITANRGKGFIEDQVVAWPGPVLGLLDRGTSPAGASSPRTAPNFYQRYRATTDSALRCEMRALRRIARDRRPISTLKRDKDGRWKADRPSGWTPGPASLFIRPAFRRQLNPRFVEWLMSWPPGLTNFACSETALQTHRAAWRSELASMTSLPAAPPAQLSLFG